MFRKFLVLVNRGKQGSCEQPTQTTTPSAQIKYFLPVKLFSLSTLCFWAVSEIFISLDFRRNVEIFLEKHFTTGHGSRRILSEQASNKIFLLLRSSPREGPKINLVFCSSNPILRWLLLGGGESGGGGGPAQQL